MSTRNEEEPLYMELSVQNIPEYLRRRQREIGVFAPDTEIEVQEIGDGNLNFVFRAYDARNLSQSVVLKQAPPYIKILGPDYKLTPERLTYESRALEEYNRLAPVFSPHQIYYDSTHYIIVMEDLSDHHILRGDLIQGVVNPQVAENIAQFMAITHSRTHTRNLTPPRVKRFIERFDNHVMQGITADYIFTKPFIDDPTNFYTEGLEPEVNAIKADSALRNQIQRLKEIFSGARQGLTHGDLHTGSVMVKGDSTKVIDSEFVFYGSVGFDIGLYWANYWLSYFSHAENTSVRSALKSAIQRTWEVYISAFEMADEGRKAETLNDIFHESIGFAGMEVMRRIIGAAHVCDIEGIADIEKKLSAERAALAFGGALVKHHRELLTMADVMTLL